MSESVKEEKEEVPSSEEATTPPDSQQQPPDLLSALIAMDCAPKQSSDNLLSALLNMDRENLEESSLLNAAIGFKPKLKRKIVETAHIHHTSVKRVIQSDKKIGRMKHEVPLSIGMAMEHFAADFMHLCAEDAMKYKASNTIKPSHMKTVMQNNPHFGFLEKVLGDFAAPLPKRQPVSKPIPDEKKVKYEDDSDEISC